MNKLNLDTRTTVISALVEGCSIRSVERMTGVHRDTITRLMVRVGDVSALFMDAEMRELTCRHLQMDEIWAYVGKKQRHLSAWNVLTHLRSSFATKASRILARASLALSS